MDWLFKVLYGFFINVLSLECPKNEHFDTCGTSCEDTCEAVDKPCTKECVEGCFCDDGLVRGELRDCYDPLNCYSKNSLFYFIIWSSCNFWT